MITFHLCDDCTGNRTITLYFLRADHLELFLHAVRPIFVPEPLRDRCRLDEKSVRNRMGWASTKGCLYTGGMPGFQVSDSDVIWSNPHEGCIRAIHPFYNEQMVWVSKLSEDVIDWLSDRAEQLRFWNADYKVVTIGTPPKTVVHQLGHIVPPSRLVLSISFMLRFVTNARAILTWKTIQSKSFVYSLRPVRGSSRYCFSSNLSPPTRRM